MCSILPKCSFFSFFSFFLLSFFPMADTYISRFGTLSLSLNTCIGWPSLMVIMLSTPDQTGNHSNSLQSWSASWVHDGLMMRWWWDHDEFMMGSWWDDDGTMMSAWWDHDEVSMRSWWDDDDEMIRWWDYDERSSWAHDVMVMRSWWDHDMMMMRSP